MQSGLGKPRKHDGQDETDFCPDSGAEVYAEVREQRN